MYMANLQGKRVLYGLLKDEKLGRAFAIFAFFSISALTCLGCSETLKEQMQDELVEFIGINDCLVSNPPFTEYIGELR